MHYRKASLVRKVLLPTLLITFAQAVLFYGVFAVGGTMDRLLNNAYDMFAEKVSGRKSDLENEMVQRWSNLKESVGSVESEAADFMARKNSTVDALAVQETSDNELLEDITPQIIYLLRKNAVTGAFLVLSPDSDGNGKHAGIYIRDNDPNSNPNDYSDLLVERGPASVAKPLGLALDSLWTPQFDFSSDDEATRKSYDFYFKPYEAALSHPELEYSDLGYWSKPFYLNPGDRNDSTQIITYTVPLRLGDGTIFGVLGIELSVNHMVTNLPSKELHENSKTGYALAVMDKNQLSASGTSGASGDLAALSGSYLKQALGDSKTIAFESKKEHNSFSVLSTSSNGSAGDIVCYTQPITLYNTHTPFESDQWVLVGLISKGVLLDFYNQFNTLLVLSLICALAVGAVGAFIMSKMVSRPVGALANQLRNANPSEPIVLANLNIAEIDELSDVIQGLSKQVVDFSSKLSTILEMAGYSIAAFEYETSQPEQIICTRRFFDIFHLETPANDTSNYVSAEFMQEQFDSINDKIEEVSEDGNQVVYNLGETLTPYWVRLRLIYEEDRVLGVVTDITQEILERRKIEYDRDYDLLTNLFNRRAFHANMQRLFQNPDNLKISALIMIDLDNLKFVNDTYGHDYGDEYIRLAADALKRITTSQVILSRLSGDEFVIFLYGQNSKEDVRVICDEIQENLRTSIINLPKHATMQVRASAGIAWYPYDSRQYEELVRYADFAMYLVKRTNKGQFTEFNVESYNKEAYLLQCREELNTILEQSLVDYEFQPIVEVATGKIFAYEALMRPSTDNIKTPFELISLARSQSKLPQIERLTLFRSMECFLKEEISNSDCLLFINSLSNQMLPDDELQQFEVQYASYLNRLVVELTEEERGDNELTHRKLAYLEKWGAQLALDDYGGGYNSETALVDLSPDYIKLDMSIIHNIHADDNRLQMMKGIIQYCDSRGIKIIAEGVECKEEMDAVIGAGVRYLQGFYLAKPVPHPPLELPGPLRNEVVEAYRKTHNNS